MESDLNKKRNRDEENKSNKKIKKDGNGENDFDDFSDSENNDNEEIADGVLRQNMPKKSKYRMRAHINPLSEISIQ
jgi:hypothetical protein